MSAERGPIVCATRGGEGSRAVKDRAVELARADQLPLVFLYILDVEAIEDQQPQSGGRALNEALRAELRWVGRALLEVAKLQAARRGVDATLEIREGAVREHIGRFAREVDASRLLLGAPRGTTANVFGDDAIERFANQISSEAGVEVEVVRPEEGTVGSA